MSNNPIVERVHKTLERAKQEIIDLTDAESGANKIFYPKYIDKTLSDLSKANNWNETEVILNNKEIEKALLNDPKLYKAFNIGREYERQLLNREAEEEPQGKEEQKFYAVEFAGYWQIKTKPFYDAGKNILDAEDVGNEQAEKNANLIVNLLNNHNGTP